MLVNFLGVNLTKFARLNIELALGVIFFLFFFSFFRCDCNGHEISQKEQKNYEIPHLITVEKQHFPNFFW